MQGASRLLGLLLVAGFAGALAFTEISDGDLGFHLATGRYILAHGQIPATNVLSYTNPDFPWHLHQWLPGVLFEWVSQRWGVGGLQALKIALVVGTWLTAYGAARFATQGALPALIAILLAASASAFRFELRPFLFTHLSLAAVLACASAHLRAERAGDARASRRALLYACAVPVAACHFHAGVLDSWLVLVALAAGTWLEPLRARFTSSEPQPPCTARRGALGAAALLASIGLSALSLALYHPIGARILLFPFEMGSDAYLAQHLVEFRPPLSFPPALLAPYWLLAGLTLLTLLVCARRLHTFWLFATLGFLLLSLKHVRLAFGFSIVAVPVLAQGIELLTARARKSTPQLAAVLLALLGLYHRYSFASPGVALSEWTFPSYYFRYLETYQLRGPDYVSDAWAAPLLGRAFPARKAFFDNRFEAYPRSFFLDVYQHIRYARPGWDALLDRYGVELVLMRYTTDGEARFQRGAPNLRQRLVSDPRWTLVTFDDSGMLALRSEGKNRAHAQRWALPNLDPDRMRFLGPPRASLSALTRELARGNDATRVLLFAALAERDAGHVSAAEALLRRAAERPEAAELLRRLLAPPR